MTGRISNTDLFLRALLIAAENVVARWQTEDLPIAVRTLEQICKQARGAYLVEQTTKPAIGNGVRRQRHTPSAGKTARLIRCRRFPSGGKTVR